MPINNQSVANDRGVFGLPPTAVDQQQQQQQLKVNDYEILLIICAAVWH